MNKDLEEALAKVKEATPKDVLEAFEASGLPVGHLEAFKVGYNLGGGAGYLKAKRQMVAIIDDYMEKAGSVEGSIVSELRNYIRNVMLWRNI